MGDGGSARSVDLTPSHIASRKRKFLGEYFVG